MRQPDSRFVLPIITVSNDDTHARTYPAQMNDSYDIYLHMKMHASTNIKSMQQ